MAKPFLASYASLDNSALACVGKGKFSIRS